SSTTRTVGNCVRTISAVRSVPLVTTITSNGWSHSWSTTDRTGRAVLCSSSRLITTTDSNGSSASKTCTPTWGDVSNRRGCEPGGAAGTTWAEGDGGPKCYPPLGAARGGE